MVTGEIIVSTQTEKVRDCLPYRTTVEVFNQHRSARLEKFGTCKLDMLMDSFGWAVGFNPSDKNSIDRGHQ